eukprot:1261333-Rhodomonas_salina.1
MVGQHSGRRGKGFRRQSNGALGGSSQDTEARNAAGERAHTCALSRIRRWRLTLLASSRIVLDTAVVLEFKDSRCERGSSAK